ncbi:MAG: septum formation initiator family protein [Candidatus Neomarinimicrobiota bacterium]
MSRASIKTHQNINKKAFLERPFIFNGILILLVVISLISYMYIRNGLEAYNSRNITLKESNSRLQQELVYLKSEINDLSRPGQIQKKAKEKLGMVNSTPQRDIIFIAKKK